MRETARLNPDGEQKEKIVYRNEMLHYGLYRPDPNARFFSEIPWHWHDEFEFGQVLSGAIRYRTDRREYVLRAGDGIFINSGILHELSPLEPREDVKLQSQFFDKSFLSGASGSVFDLKYMAPVQEQRQLDAVALYASDPEARPALRLLQEGARLSMEGGRFFELRLRSLFSELWESVYQWAAEAREREPSHDRQTDERIKQMMTYLQDHCHEKVTVAALAQQIPVSERECYRLFQSCLGMPPVEFLLSLRLQKAQALLAYTDRSILEIALETGFGTSSYFGKMFRRQHHITPGKYRALCRREGEHSSGRENAGAEDGGAL